MIRAALKVCYCNLTTFALQITRSLWSQWTASLCHHDMLCQPWALMRLMSRLSSRAPATAYHPATCTRYRPGTVIHWHAEARL